MGELVAEVILPFCILFGLGCICLAQAIEVIRMTPWEHDREWRRLNPDWALRYDLGLAPAPPFMRRKRPSKDRGASHG